MYVSKKKKKKSNDKFEKMGSQTGMKLETYTKKQDRQINCRVQVIYIFIYRRKKRRRRIKRKKKKNTLWVEKEIISTGFLY